MGLNARSERFLFVLDDSFDKLDRRIVANAILHVLNNNTKNEQYMKPDYIHELVKKYLTNESVSVEDIKRGIKFLENEVAVHVYWEIGYPPYGCARDSTRGYHKLNAPVRN